MLACSAPEFVAEVAAVAAAGQVARPKVAQADAVEAEASLLRCHRRHQVPVAALQGLLRIPRAAAKAAEDSGRRCEEMWRCHG